MPSLLHIVKNIYRTVLLLPVRQNPFFTRERARIFSHNLIYDRDYYNTGIEQESVRSARAISHSIMEEFHPKSVVDVGCGTGALLEALREKGCEVFGLEYSEAALEYCRARRLDVEKFDIENDRFGLNRIFDVASSLEVAEHILAKHAGRYLDLLTGLSGVVVFSAASPGQGGTDHVNEQPPSYWIDLFNERGFRFNKEISFRWRRDWKESGEVAGWYCENLMVFQRK